MGKTVTAAAGVRIHRALAGLVTAAGLLTLLAMFLSAPDTDAVQPSGGLRVAGYNIQQGYDILEQRGHEAQCEVLKEIDADIVALSETDTTRIAGANFDIVRYLAQCLDMYSHAGPKTGIATFGYAILSKYPIENPEVYHFFSGANQPSSANPGSTSCGDQAAVIKA
jgi:hypothetical protein